MFNFKTKKKATVIIPKDNFRSIDNVLNFKTSPL